MAIHPEDLREARRTVGLTQQDLADRLGVSVRTIVNWENVDKNGVPGKWERKVLGLLGAHVHQAQILREHGELLAGEGPSMESIMEAGPPSWLEEEQYGVESDEFETALETEARLGRHPQEYKRMLLAQFSDLDLQEELSQRHRSRGIRPTNWSLAAIEADPRRGRELAELGRVISRLAGSTADPDYSKLSQDEHRLAAYEGDKHIPFDADPED